MKRREIKSLAERFASLRHIAAIGRPARTSTRSQDGGGLNLAAGPATRCRDWRGEPRPAGAAHEHPAEQALRRAWCYIIWRCRALRS